MRDGQFGGWIWGEMGLYGGREGAGNINIEACGCSPRRRPLSDVFLPLKTIWWALIG